MISEDKEGVLDDNSGSEVRAANTFILQNSYKSHVPKLQFIKQEVSTFYDFWPVICIGSLVAAAISSQRI